MSDTTSPSASFSSHTLNSSSSTLNSPPSNLPHYITTKLSQDNYLIWVAQVKAYLYGQNLFGYVDGSLTTPPEKLSDGSPDKDFLAWFQQDQLVLSILLASLSDKILSQFVRHKNARAMWIALETSFSQQTHARLVYLHQQLTTLKKGGESIQKYHKRATILADSLAAAGKPVPNEDFITYLLAGLGSDFDTIVTVLNTQRHFLTIEGILSHLLIFEERMTHQYSISLPIEYSANAVNLAQSHSIHNRGCFSTFHRGNSNNSGHGLNSYSTGRGFGRYNGRNLRGNHSSRIRHYSYSYWQLFSY